MSISRRSIPSERWGSVQGSWEQEPVGALPGANSKRQETRSAFERLRDAERPRPAPTASGGQDLLRARRADTSIPPKAVGALIAMGYPVEQVARDYEREGRLSVPGAAEWSVRVDGLSAMARDRDLASLMAPLTLTPKLGGAPEPGVISVFVPGLNTPEPESSRRTQLYVDALGTPMANLANGTRASLGDWDPVRWLPFKIKAGRRDWMSAGLSYLGLRRPPLSQRVADLLAVNFAQPQPQKMRLAFYSDATISLVQGMELFIEQEVERRMARAIDVKESPGLESIRAQVQSDLRKHVFVELHGNACFRLPKGPRYLVWTDVNDPLTNRDNPFAPQGKVGVSSAHPDPAQKDAVYIDYEGLYSTRGFDAHNLAANGIHAIAQTLRRNGVSHGEALYEKAVRGEMIKIPGAYELGGTEEELWG